MDIRRWFTTAGASKSVENITDKRSKNGEAKKPFKAGKKRRIIESDDDEDPLPNKKKESPSKKGNQLKSKTEDKKAVSVSDFFGDGPIKREKKAIPSMKEKEHIHEDNDFEATLKQLDSKPLKDSKPASKIKKELGENERLSEGPASKIKKKLSDSGRLSEGPASKIKKKLSDDVKPSEDTLRPKKKSKSSSSVQMEVTPNSEKLIIKIEEDKPVAKKPRGSANYASYLHREGPKALGSKEIPEGEEQCLAGLTFVITGVLESLERDEAKALVEKYGGKVMTTLSKKTKYIVIGRDAGSSKLDKAEKLGTKQLDEDGLLDLVRTMPGKKGCKKKSPKKEDKSSSAPVELQAKNNTEELEFMEEDDDLFLDSSILTDNETASPKDAKKSPKKEFMVIAFDERKSNVLIEEHSTPCAKVQKAGDFFMWVDKYKPSSIKQVIGQQGDKSNAKKLLQWLLNWHKNRRLNKKPGAPGRWNSQDDGSGHKAALLSGSPGVGKTTTAQLVCKEAGYDFFEMNASDTRSKKNLQQSVSQLLGNQTLADCFRESTGKVSNKHVIIMDEVDGMAGNEDRGGMRELIDFIKASKVPIICICNDRNHPKIRSLSNYCFDLRFQKPRVEQIKAAMMSIAFKEGIKVSPNALQDVIVAANQDVRQVLHNMSMWSAKAKDLTPEQTKQDIGRGTKHIKMGPFDVLRDVFAIGNNPKASIIDKSALFFHDYSIAPLFVQENYVHVIPKAAEGDKKKHLTLLSQAAESICIGDVIDKQIRNQNSWGLLPTQAIFASVVPGELLCGHLRQMINFPAWLGKHSNRNHMDRILQELNVHMRMRITGNKTDVALEYLPLLKRALTKPLIDNEQDGVPEVLKSMEYYHLLREDFDSIIDLSLWPDQIDPRTKISTKVKSAFTRAYNKECGKNPYAVTNVKKKKGSAANLDEDNPDDEIMNESEDEDNDKLENDAMIKVKKPPKKNAAAQNEASTSKEKKKNPPKKGKGK